MSVSNYAELRAHFGHPIQIVPYGGTNLVIECTECHEILLSFDKEGERHPYQDALDSWQDMTIRPSGRASNNFWELSWEFCDEGDDGEFRSSDPTDTPRLRIYAFWMVNTAGGYERNEVFSYCTLATPADGDTELMRAGASLLDLLYRHTPDTYPRKQVEEWTWVTRTPPADHPVNDPFPTEKE